MTKIAELNDKGAVVAWSPIGGGGGDNNGREYADVIALGSKVSSGLCHLYIYTSMMFERGVAMLLFVCLFVCLFDAWF